MNWTKLIRKISTTVLLLAVLNQMITVILFVTDFDLFDFSEIHEIGGFVFFSMVLVHIFLFRKSLKNMIFNH